MTAWFRHHAGVSMGDAGRAVATARRLRGLPVTTAAALDGSLSGGQVKALVANVSDRTAALFAGHEAAVVPTLVPLSVPETTGAMRWWAARAEATLDEGDPQPPRESSVHLSCTLHGRWRVDGDLDALDGEILDTALRLAEAPRTEGEELRRPSERWGEALAIISRFFIEHREHPPASRHRPHVNLIATLHDVRTGGDGHFADGVVVDGPSLASLVCDSVMHRILMAGSTILDYGTATRTVSANLYSAVVVRDRCRFPGM